MFLHGSLKHVNAAVMYARVIRLVAPLQNPAHEPEIGKIYPIKSRGRCHVVVTVNDTDVTLLHREVECLADSTGA